jgi:hypothetical protein
MATLLLELARAASRLVEALPRGSRTRLDVAPVSAQRFAFARRRLHLICKRFFLSSQLGELHFQATNSLSQHAELSCSHADVDLAFLRLEDRVSLRSTCLATERPGLSFELLDDVADAEQIVAVRSIFRSAASLRLR